MTLEARLSQLHAAAKSDPGHATGDAVRVKWHDGKWYGGRVRSVGKRHSVIRWDDGVSPDEKMPHETIKRRTPAARTKPSLPPLNEQIEPHHALQRLGYVRTPHRDMNGDASYHHPAEFLDKKHHARVSKALEKIGFQRDWKHTFPVWRAGAGRGQTVSHSFNTEGGHDVRVT